VFQIEIMQCVNFIAIITPNVEKDKNVSQQEEVMDCVKVVAMKTLIFEIGQKCYSNGNYAKCEFRCYQNSDC